MEGCGAGEAAGDAASGATLAAGPSAAAIAAAVAAASGSIRGGDGSGAARLTAIGADVGMVADVGERADVGAGVDAAARDPEGAIAVGVAVGLVIGETDGTDDIAFSVGGIKGGDCGVGADDMGNVASKDLLCIPVGAFTGLADGGSGDWVEDTGGAAEVGNCSKVPVDCRERR